MPPNRLVQKPPNPEKWNVLPPSTLKARCKKQPARRRTRNDATFRCANYFLPIVTAAPPCLDSTSSTARVSCQDHPTLSFERVILQLASVSLPIHKNRRKTSECCVSP